MTKPIRILLGLSLAVSGCALFSTKGAVVELHLATCIAEQLELHPEESPEQIILSCGARVTPELLDLISKTRAAKKAGACGHPDAGPVP